VVLVVDDDEAGEPGGEGAQCQQHPRQTRLLGRQHALVGQLPQPTTQRELIGGASKRSDAEGISGDPSRPVDPSTRDLAFPTGPPPGRDDSTATANATASRATTARPIMMPTAPG
jgi:hypothetical protein